MCGIAGLFSPNSHTADTIERMLERLVHRGPDAGNTWFDAQLGIALGHRRLSVLDLSPAGAQPMHSTSGRLVIVFNGEIYNHAEIRLELEVAGVAPAWRGHSDTEVILAAIEHWGLEGALQRLVGMYAFALWDRNDQTLSLVRDRMGEKPLYYGWAGRDFVFASELKALRAHPAFDDSIDRDALALYIGSGYVPGERSIYSAVRKLPPGSYLRLTAAMMRRESDIEVVRYWSLRTAARAGSAADTATPADAAVNELDALLRATVQGQMVADVPIGAFLSGGIDSSTVVALMQAQSNRPVHTFSIGFGESDYDEAQHAKAVATHLGTDHTELYVSASQALDVVPLLPEIYDEPFADPSQIPTFLVSQLARQSVTVSLSGDGGDEVFGGYNRYTHAVSLWNKLSTLPQPLRNALGTTFRSVPPRVWEVLFSASSIKAPGEKMTKLATLFGASNRAEWYERLISHWSDRVVLGARYPLPSRLDEALEGNPLDSFAADMMLADGLEYLPNDILVKLDRASMAVSLESRVPFLDHRVVEYAWHLPMAMKVHGGEGKWILRQVLERYVPRSLFDRPKMGFGIPLAQWLCGPLREWAEALLDESGMHRDGFLDAALVRRRWNEHVKGNQNHHHALWTVLMFQAWLQHNRRSTP